MSRVLFVAALVLIPTGLAAGDQFEIYGYTYFTPPEQVGTVVTLVGFLEPPVGFTYPMGVDFDNNEYTFYFQSTITGITPGPITTTYTYADAEFMILEDAGKNGAYGSFPPNATSPSTFTDGTLILSGTLSDISRIDYNSGFPEPTVVANCTFTGGGLLTELVQATGWTFHGGLSSNPLTGIPAGYQRNWAVRIVLSTVGVERSSWGRIKALYSLP